MMPYCLYLLIGMPHHQSHVAVRNGVATNVASILAGQHQSYDRQVVIDSPGLSETAMRESNG
jgi:hypothetical protein